MQRLLVCALLIVVLGVRLETAAVEQQTDFAKAIVGVWRAVASVDESIPSQTERSHQPAIYVFTRAITASRASTAPTQGRMFRWDCPKSSASWQSTSTGPDSLRIQVPTKSETPR